MLVLALMMRCMIRIPVPYELAVSSTMFWLLVLILSTHLVFQNSLSLLDKLLRLT